MTNDQAEIAKARFLQELRNRVAWQADEADRLRNKATGDAEVIELHPERADDEPRTA